MSTTDVIIEHLISGIQAAIWLLLLTVLLFGDSWVSWATIKDIPTELIIAFIAIVYPIGIFIDEIADRLLNPFVEIIRTHIFNKEDIPNDKRHKVRVSYILPYSKEDDSLRLYFNYVRTRIRIARASIINFSLITIFLILFLIVHSSNDIFLLIMVFCLGTLITLIAIFSWYSFTKTFVQRTAILWKINEKEDNN